MGAKKDAGVREAGNTLASAAAGVEGGARVVSSRGAVDPEWSACARIAYANGSTFYFACQVLPREQKRAIHAIYAYCRIADDIVDRSPLTGRETAARDLDAWEAQLDAPQDPVAIAFAVTRDRYGVPVQAARDLVAGVRMDLVPQRYATWSDLELYCQRVAGTVGAMAAPVLGCRNSEAIPAAIDLGVAMQLTNILRDVAEDARMGRVYLPEEDLRLFGCTPQAILTGKPTGDFTGLIQFQIERARKYYASAERGYGALPVPGRTAAVAAGELYSRILKRIEAQDHDVFRGRARVSTAGKIQALPKITSRLVRLSFTRGRT